jgi:hypothetical protein
MTALCLRILHATLVYTNDRQSPQSGEYAPNEYASLPTEWLLCVVFIRCGPGPVSPSRRFPGQRSPCRSSLSQRSTEPLGLFST